MAVNLNIKTNSKEISAKFKKFGSVLPRIIDKGVKQAGFQLVDRIRNEVSVLLVAGDWYGYDHYLRFGYGAKEKDLISALEIISPVLKRL